MAESLALLDFMKALANLAWRSVGPFLASRFLAASDLHGYFLGWSVIAYFLRITTPGLTRIMHPIFLRSFVYFFSWLSHLLRPSRLLWVSGLSLAPLN